METKSSALSLPPSQNLVGRKKGNGFEIFVSVSVKFMPEVKMCCEYSESFRENSAK